MVVENTPLLTFWDNPKSAKGSMFNYPGEYFQLSWGVFSTTLGSIFNYPGESKKSKRFARGSLKKIEKKNITRERRPGPKVTTL